MPIDFSSLPMHIQVSLVQKLEAKDFVSLLKTSKSANYAAQGLKTGISLPYEIGQHISLKYDHGEIQANFIHWDSVSRTKTHSTTAKLSQLSSFKLGGFFIEIEHELNDDFCRSQIQYFHRSGSTAIAVFLDRATVTCSPELFQILLEVTDSTIMTSAIRRLSREYVGYVPFRVDDIHIVSDLTDSDLLKIKPNFLGLDRTKVSSCGINAFLREWYEGKREFRSFCITTEKEISTDEILKGMEYTATGQRQKYEISNGSTSMRIKFTPEVRLVEAYEMSEDENEGGDKEDEVEEDESEEDDDVPMQFD